MLDSYEFLTIMVSIAGISGGLIAYVFRKIGCIPKLNTKINILYSLMKTHLKLDGTSNVDVAEFDKFFDEDNRE